MLSELQIINAYNTIPSLPESESGFVASHALKCNDVATLVNSIILFRAPGPTACGLIKENYGMKSFRIDTKSCNWGPMSGFACMDPRLTKDAKYIERNKTWTKESLTGEINTNYFESVEDKTWKADVMPIVISHNRFNYLVDNGIISPERDGKEFIGTSSMPNSDISLHWRLVPVATASNPWLKAAEPGQGNYSHAAADDFVLCVNKKAPSAFGQQYSAHAEKVNFRGHETILGLINPGTHSRGYKACVTADYDLFSVWPAIGRGDNVATQHNVASALEKHFERPNGLIPGGVKRKTSVDERLQLRTPSNVPHPAMEHYRFGDVNARIMNVKTRLNTALQSVYKGGNAVHHNDECGNIPLAKETLADCFPLVGFVPGKQIPITITSNPNFKALVHYAKYHNYKVIAKPSWLTQAGIENN